MRKINPIDSRRIICHPMISHSNELLVFPAVTVTIIPITQIRAVLVKLRIALARALMYLVILRPMKLKKVIERTVIRTIPKSNLFYHTSLKYCSGLSM